MIYRFYGNRIGNKSVNFHTGADNFMDGINSLDMAARDMGLDISRTVTLYQSQSTDVIHAKAFEFRKPADAAVTREEGLILCIRTADCAPILLYDNINSVIGAAHAGWRGALSGIIENTVTEMIKLGAKRHNLRAMVGPMLLQQSFICQADMRDVFIGQDLEFSKYFNKADDGNLHFNFEDFVQNKLMSCGLDKNSIEISAIDTYTSTDFYSYRLGKHQGMGDNTRNCAMIFL